MTPTLRAFLRTGDLDELAGIRDELVGDRIAGDRTGGDRTGGGVHRDNSDPADARPTDPIRDVIREWTDRQSVANLLMYPELIPEDLRVAALLRGLTDRRDGYLRLAAAVGAGDAEPLSDADRQGLGDALLDLVSSDTGPAPVRAAAQLGALLTVGDAPDLVVLLRHPEDAVRHNLTAALVRIPGRAQPGRSAGRPERRHRR